MRAIAWILFLATILDVSTTSAAGESWPQYKLDSRNSGDAADRDVTLPLGLVAAAPLGDAVFTAPVVADGRVYAVDGSGTAYCLDAATLRVLWRRDTAGGPLNCSNVSSPALAGRYVHFGTTAGRYYVLDASDGNVVCEVECGEPVFSSPVVGNQRVYFATLGARVYALTPAGNVCWTWDFVREHMGFSGNRWSGEDWRKHLAGRVTPKQQFLCARDIAIHDNTVVIAAGGSVVWLKDRGSSARPQVIHQPNTPSFGLAVRLDGAVYRQWHFWDNVGQVDILRLRGGEVETGVVPGTKTDTHSGLASFCSVSLRGAEVYRTRPEAGFGLCRHLPDQDEPQSLGGYPSIAPPILLRNHVVHGGLDGRLYVIPLSGDSTWAFKTAFDKAISAPAAVCDGRVYFGCEDGYLYALGPGGKAPLPTRDLELWKIRTPLKGKWADAKYDRFTSFADWRNTNVSPEQLRLPLRLHWVRRFEGSAKHFSTCGDGRMVTHTAEGQVFAVEQTTGRLLWRRYFPGVHISYTSPLCHQRRVLVAQAGRRAGRLRCLNAATGDLLWEAPFAGSPSWSRQLPPVVYKDVAIYMFGTGRYDDEVPEEERVKWLWSHDGVTSYPKSHRPMLRAFNVEAGKEVWNRDFSEYGSGGDESGVCLLDDVLYYSCFFGSAARRGDATGPHGVTAALDPLTGRTHWLTTDYWVHSGCSISGAEGRLYVGGYCRDPETRAGHVWCLSAKDGSLVWRSDPLPSSIAVVTIGPQFLFAHAHGRKSHLLDKQTGKILTTLNEGYKCSRFTLAGSYLLGPNLDITEVSNLREIRLLGTGPRLDPSECIGGIASNGRVFYTCHAGGLQASLISAAAEAAPRIFP